MCRLIWSSKRHLGNCVFIIFKENRNYNLLIPPVQYREKNLSPPNQ